MEASHDSMHRVGAGRQNVLQSAMCTARKEQTVSIQSQFMTEIVMDVIAVGVLYIEILISLRHRMCLMDMSYGMDALCYRAGLVYHDKSVIIDLWPLRGYTMQISSLGEELTAHGMG